MDNRSDEMAVKDGWSSDKSASDVTLPGGQMNADSESPSYEAAANERLNTGRRRKE